MYRALLSATTNSLTMMKQRAGSRTSTGFLFVKQPYFELETAILSPSYTISPSLGQVQAAINRTALTVLQSWKKFYAWDQQDQPEDARETFFLRDHKVWMKTRHAKPLGIKPPHLAGPLGMSIAK